MRRKAGRAQEVAGHLTAALGFVSFSKPELAEKSLFCNAPRRLERAIRESAFNRRSTQAWLSFKMEAARRQLDCVIRLYFDNDDLLAVHAIVTSLGVHLA